MRKSKVMISKLVVLQVTITELPILVEKKSKQMALNDKLVPMLLPINVNPFENPFRFSNQFTLIFDPLHF